MKVKILVPETLAEITLEQYQKFLKISKDNEDSLFLQQKMIEIFCNIEMSTVLATRYSSIKEITEHLNEIFKIKPKFISSFKRGNLEFGFIPNFQAILGLVIIIGSGLYVSWRVMKKNQDQDNQQDNIIEPL